MVVHGYCLYRPLKEIQQSWGLIVISLWLQLIIIKKSLSEIVSCANEIILMVIHICQINYCSAGRHKVWSFFKITTFFGRYNNNAWS